MKLLLTSLLKTAFHAHDRGMERLSLPPESVDGIQKALDKVWYSTGRTKLQGDNYYSPLRDHEQNVLGYAAFKRVGNPGKPRLVLSTILSRNMKPKGDNIGHFFQSSVKGDYKPTGYQIEKYKGMEAIPDNKDS